jgi:hypothetical protein
MNEAAEWQWQFLCFKSEREGCPVQSWFDGLPDDAQDEIRDLLGYLRIKTKSKWEKPSFDPLAGEGGISELRPGKISREESGVIKTYTYRIYGFRGPREFEHSYTFLHGNDKNVRNDKDGKRIAKERLVQIERREATVCEFQERADSQIDEEQGREN